MMRRILLLSCALLRCICSPAQVASPIGMANGTAEVFGSGERPSLAYAEEVRPTNVILGDLTYEGAWDSNILDTAKSHVADFEQITAGDFLIQHLGENLQATIGYAPFYNTFVQHPEFNQFNQMSSADIKLIQNAAWSVRARDSYIRQTGSYSPLSITASPPAVGPPGGLNGTIYTPLTTEEANSARLDILYQRSIRSLVDMFGGYDNRSYSFDASPTTATLYKTRGLTLGTELAWRPSEHSMVGILGVFQHLETPDTTSTGTSLVIATALPTIGFAPRPGWQVQAYGGPQIWAEPADPNREAANSRNLTWAGGGTVSRQANTSAIYVTANRSLADGGGLLSFVETSQLGAGLRSRVAGTWDSSLEATFARNREVGSVNEPGSVSEVTATASVVHPLAGHLTLHAGYELIRQLSSGSAPAIAGFARSRVVCGLSWQFGALPLGH